MSKTAASRPRAEFVQATRFVAATLVLVTHTTFYYHERIDAAVATWHAGEIGVPVFFVISGFVIAVSSRHLPIDASGAKEFMLRRLLRIVPLYWLVTIVKIAIALSLPALVHHNHFDLLHAIKSLLFIPAYNSAGEIRPIHGVGWTLLHEMVFYVVFASMMIVKFRPVPAASIVLILLYVMGLASPPEAAFMAVATSPINLYFVLGMWIGSATLETQDKPLAKPALLFVLLGAVTGRMSGLFPLEVVPLDPLVLLTGCALLAVGSRRMLPVAGLPVALGDSSYALYLFHPLIAPAALLLIHRIAPGMGAAAEIAVAVGVTIALAHLLHRWVESPLNELARQTFLGRGARARSVGEAT